MERVCEVAACYIKDLNLITIYRSPFNVNVNNFIDIMQQVLEVAVTYKNINKKILITGDFNVNFLDRNDNNTQKIVQLFSS